MSLTAAVVSAIDQIESKRGASVAAE